MVKFLFNFIISPFYDMLLLSLSEALNIWKSAWWLPFLKSKGKLGHLVVWLKPIVPSATSNKAYAFALKQEKANCPPD